MTSTRERHERWRPGRTYVIGHQRPDTDAIASAIGCAWFLQQTGNDAHAARAGTPNDQATWALKRFDAAAPTLLTGVAPTFGHVAVPQPAVSPSEPLPAAMARVAEGDRIVPVVDDANKPVGIVTALALARAYTAPVNVTVMLAQPCGQVAEPAVTFRERDRISDHRAPLLHSEADDFLVVNDAGEYVGIATRSRVLQPPRARLYLVDHNELGQAVADAGEAEIIGVLDHHRLGNPETSAPIPFQIDPVGSTSTLVAEFCRAHSLDPPAGVAGMLLAGLLSDTLNFRSPTATDRDTAVAGWLAGIAGVAAGEFGDELLRASPGLTARPADEIINADRKSYQMGGRSISLAQVEVTDLRELDARRAELLAALEERRSREGLAMLALMVTDVVAGRSRMLAVGENRILLALPFDTVAPGEFDLLQMVSRKKQLVPALAAVLEEPV